MPRRLSLGIVLLACAASRAEATLTISAAPTHNVSCSAGLCTTTSARGVLNADELTAMLASGDIAVQSTSRSKDIVVSAAVAWSSTHRLTLEAFRALIVKQPIAVNGTSALTIDTDTSSDSNFAFAGKGKISFLDTASDLVINGDDYALVADISQLTDSVTQHPTKDIALVRDYDAGPDGIYPTDPGMIFQGTFEGLGNTIRNLKISVSLRGVHVGLFYQVGAVRHFHLDHASVKSTGTNGTVGLLAGGCVQVSDVSVSGSVAAAPGSFVGGMCGLLGGGTVSNARAAGTVTGKGDSTSAANGAGGLVGFLDGGLIENSSSSAKVAGDKGWIAGGLVGSTEFSVYRITGSFATGTVTVGDDGVAGGLVGDNEGQHPVDNSYATGFVGGGVNSTVGGLIGINDAPVADCYATGAVSSGSGNAVGGLIGNDMGPNDLTDTYWDVETSGQSHGVGNNTNYPGVTGLTTAQFQSGLPSGFDATIWSENAGVNGGFPYLIANPQ